MSKHQLLMERRGRQLQQRQQRDVAGNPSSTAAASEPTRQHRLPDQLHRRAKDNRQMSTTISQTTTPHPSGLVSNSIQFCLLFAIIVKQSVFSTNTMKVGICSQQCHGTTVYSMTHLVVSFFCCNFRHKKKL